MIEKLEKHTIGENAPGTVPLMVAPTAEQQVDKINELVDVVNALIKENNFHEMQIDELQMKLKTLQGAFIVRLDENDEPATATPVFKED